MTQKNILVVTSNVDSNQEVQDWLNTTEDFNITVANDHERAIEVAHRQALDLVLIDTAGDVINYKKLKAVLPIIHPEVLLLHYEGETAGVLEHKISEAFAQKKRERMKRLLVLDSSAQSSWGNLPGFSAN